MTLARHDCKEASNSLWRTCIILVVIEAPTAAVHERLRVPPSFWRGAVWGLYFQRKINLVFLDVRGHGLCCILLHAEHLGLFCAVLASVAQQPPGV